MAYVDWKIKIGAAGGSGGFMKIRLTTLFALTMAGAGLSGPAFSQQASTTAPAAKTAETGSQSPGGVDSDETFMTGIRRIGVMAGEVVQCTPTEGRQDQIADAMQLANQIALHFGLAAAFNFTGAVGYGSGKPFDKAGCHDAMSGWDGIKQKYLDQ